MMKGIRREYDVPFENIRLTRRSLLRTGAIGLGGLMLGGVYRASYVDHAALGHLEVRRAGSASGGVPNLDATSVPRFVLPLPNALDLRLTPRAEVDPVTGLGFDHHSIVMRQGMHDFGLGGGKLTPIWGYNGQYPGPTIEAHFGREVRMTQTNDLRLPPDSHGRPWPTSIHYHGGITAPEHDGYAGNIAVFNPDGSPVLENGKQKRLPTELTQGLSWTYVFPNVQTATTNFYHDHGMHHTSENVYRGLAGFYLLRDDSEKFLQDHGFLPVYPYEVPIVLQDKLFFTDGSLDWDAELTGFKGTVGNVQTVNGVAWPRMQVEPRKYRFRILNGNTLRRYDLALSNGRPLHLLGTDSGFLNEPASVPMVRLFFAERCDVILDFSGLAPGTQVKLLNTNDEAKGTPMSEIMLFEVVPPRSATLVDTVLPDAAAFKNAGIGWEVLTDRTTVDAALAFMTANNIVRDFRFDRGDGFFTINGKIFEEDRFDAQPRLGTTEVWTFRNSSGGWYHPIHLHLIDFQIIDRNGSPPRPWERGRKDTTSLGENEVIRVIVKWDAKKFLNFTGAYLFHCHNTDHEDHDMMTQFKVVR